MVNHAHIEFTDEPEGKEMPVLMREKTASSMRNQFARRASNAELMDFELKHDINMQVEVEHQLEILAVKKSRLPVWKILLLGTLSGLWMAVAATFANVAASGVGPTIREYVPVFPKFLVSIFAPVAMYFIVVFGGEFYSGNCMFMAVGYFKGRLTALQVLRNWALCFLANTAGCILGIWAFADITQVFETEEQRAFIRGTAESKEKLGVWISFIRGIPANIMICTSIQMGISARDMFGKLIVLHFPLMMYTVCGFEHALTNMVVVPLGIAYGAKVNIWYWLLTNVLPSAVGNAIGGGLIVGGIQTLLFNWDQGQGNTNQLHTHSTEYRESFFTNPFSKLRIPAISRPTDESELKTAKEELSNVLQRIAGLQDQLHDLELHKMEKDPAAAVAMKAAKTELRNRRKQVRRSISGRSLPSEGCRSEASVDLGHAALDIESVNS